MQLSLCMIVRNSAGTLADCLTSISPHIDDMVVVDTGSQDDTAAIATNFGARVFHFPWRDDFATARNESLRHAQGEWIFWMDSDDTIPSECGQSLRQWMNQPDEIYGVTVSHIHCPLPEALCVVDHVKLFRNRHDIRFEGRVHEQILPSIHRAGGRVAHSDLYVVHSGADFSPVARQEKRFRYLRLLELELQDRPGHPFALFNRGLAHYEGDELQQAVVALLQSLEKAGPKETFAPKAYAMLTDCYRRLGDRVSATEYCQNGLKWFPGDSEILFQQGMLAYEAGRYFEAIKAYRLVLEAPVSSVVLLFGGGCHNYKASHNLALAYMAAGKPSRAEQEWRTLLSAQHACEPAREGLVEALIRQSKFRELQAIAEKFVDYRGQIIRARIALAKGKTTLARSVAAGIECGDSFTAWNSLSQLYFDAGWVPEAELALRAMLRQWPSDAAVHHNLGVLLAATDRQAEAVEAFRRSLDLRPNSQATAEHLATALEQLGNGAEALSVRTSLAGA